MLSGFSETMRQIGSARYRTRHQARDAPRPVRSPQLGFRSRHRKQRQDSEDARADSRSAGAAAHRLGRHAASRRQGRPRRPPRKRHTRFARRTSGRGSRLENDERAYGALEILEVCRAAGVAMVFDAHHHIVHEKLDSYDDPSIGEMLALARATWPAPEWQMVHISNGRESFNDPRHSDLITDYARRLSRRPLDRGRGKAQRSGDRKTPRRVARLTHDLEHRVERAAVEDARRVL